LDLHLRGEVLRVAERGEGGARQLRVRARAGQRAESGGRWLTVRLHVQPSPREPSERLDALRRGDRLRIWCRIRRPRAFGNPGAVEPDRILRAAGLDATGSVKSARLVELIERSPRQGIPLDRIKQVARGRLDRIAAGRREIRTVLGAMLLGDRAALAPATVRRLRVSGLVHLLAISGLHVGLMVLVVLELLRRCGRRALLLAPLAGVAFCFFAVFVGGRPSVLRAVLAALALMLGRCLGREGDAFNTLTLAAALFVLVRPGTLWDVGFQLSFLATGGILLWSPALAARLPLPRLLAGGVAVSGSAYLAAAPVLAGSFGGLAPVGVGLNLVSLPLCAVILASGYGAILTLDAPWVGDALAWCCRSAVDALLALGSRAAAAEWTYLGVGPPSPALVFLYYTMALLSSVPSPAPETALRRQSIRRLGLLGFALTVAWLHLGPPPPPAGRSAEAVLIDVGQGQAVALRGTSGAVSLIDAAGSSNPRFDPGERIVLPVLRRWGVRRVEALVVTHGDVDHAGGALSLLRELEVGELWLGAGWHRDSRLARLAATALVRGAALRGVERGHRAMLAGFPLRVLAPSREQLNWSSNDRSLVLLAGVAPARLMIPGDLEQRGEQALVTSNSCLRAEALVLPHHGSRSGSGAALLNRVAPRIAAVSCGAGNRFGHPHPEVRQRLKSRGLPLWRTDKHGMIRLRTGTEGFSVESYLDPEDRSGR
jgi:competence protein ComEC